MIHETIIILSIDGEISDELKDKIKDLATYHDSTGMKEHLYPVSIFEDLEISTNESNKILEECNKHDASYFRFEHNYIFKDNLIECCECYEPHIIPNSNPTQEAYCNICGNTI